MDPKKPRAHWGTLERRLGYSFANRALLEQALTHRSHSADHNERLEFLGDALLETIISVALYHDHPGAPEGDLTRLRAAVVNGTSLATIARRLSLGKYLRLGEGEHKSGGNRRASILADAVEATLAAIYLDSDFSTCEEVTLTLFGDSLRTLPAAETLKDAKTRLQEYLQGRNLPIPSYQLVALSGPEHARRFTMAVISENHRAEASGGSRKKAEQAAAETLLSRYRDAP